MHRLVPSLALVLLAVPRGAVAQGSIAGTWRTEFDVGIRIVNGVESSEGKRHARITFQVKGDSIQGTWQNVDTLGAAVGAPRPLRGVVTDSGARIESVTPTAITMRRQGDEQHLLATMNYVLTVRGDTLVGTEQWVALDHSDRGPMRPFGAKRELR